MTDTYSSRLSEYLDASLDPAERIAFDTHIATCIECRKSLVELKAVAAWLKTDLSDASDMGLFAVIKSQIRVADKRRRTRITLQGAIAAIAAVILVLRIGTSDDPRAIADEHVGSIVDPAGVRSAVTYDAAVADLDQIVREGGRRMDRGTVDGLESSIDLIGVAIRQSEDALAKDTANEFLMKHLDRLRRARLAVMRETAAIVRAKKT